MIQEIRIQNFRSLRDVTLKLQQVNLLIGPNNSGKTNVLKALKFFSELSTGKTYTEAEFDRIITSSVKDVQSLRKSPIAITMKVKTDIPDLDGSIFEQYSYMYLGNYGNHKYFTNGYAIAQAIIKKDFSISEIDPYNVGKISNISDDFECAFSGLFYHKPPVLAGYQLIEPEVVVNKSANFQFPVNNGQFYFKEAFTDDIVKYEWVPSSIKDALNVNYGFQNALSPIIIYKVTPEELLKPYPLNNQDFVNSDASNIVSFFDVIYSNHREIAARITEDLNRFVPEFKEVVFERVEIDEDNPLRLTYGKNNKKSTDTFKRLGLKDNNGNTFWADELSEGTLYFLALLCIIHQPNPPRLLLLEEPEKGIHPRRLRETLNLIFELAEEKDIQVIMSTHSPYVVDYFSDIPESVFVFEKDEKETIVKNLQYDVIEPKSKKFHENGEEPIKYTDSLGTYWEMGFLGGVPK
ncbi:MAG: AAA family ATPase [Candidatus Kapaibacterium sp.]|nr:AAA family ATPase [Bacteroidota bacterium]